LNIHRSGVLTALAWLVPQESAARESISARSVYTIQHYHGNPIYQDAKQHFVKQLNSE